MDLLTPVLLGIGLSMDCLAVSLAIGSTTRFRRMYAATIIALSFGAFQAGMMVIGWTAGISLLRILSVFDHWVAFFLLAIIGGKMIREGLWGEGETETRLEIIRIIPLIVLSLATSIDSLAVGATIGLLQTSVLFPALIIGTICGGISFLGVLLGEQLEEILGNNMEIVGGLILILIGIRILFEHMIG
jgi:putative Mn2+ efflux pump MntP